MNKFIYRLDELIEYYKAQGLTYENFPEIKKKHHTIFPLLQPKITKPVVFYPYAGEFGSGIAKHLVWFHYYPAEYKIACIPRGYECFFPDAKEFVYDYPGPKWDEYKGEWWSYDRKHTMIWNKRPLPEDYKGTIHRYFKWKERSSDKDRLVFKKYIRSIYPDPIFIYTPMVGPREPITGLPIRTFAKVPFKTSNKYGINVDVVFANRYLAKDKHSYQKWPETIKYLQSKGLTVGGIGRKGFIFEGMNLLHNYDYENSNEASLEMLSNAKYFIGTDTGVTHLAMNFTHLKSLLFRLKDGTQDWISMYSNQNTRFIEEMIWGLERFNDEKLLFKHIDEFFV
jgi:hypothetical protein